MGLLSKENVTSTEDFQALGPTAVAHGLGSAHSQAQRDHPVQYIRDIIPALAGHAEAIFEHCPDCGLIQEDADGSDWVVDLSDDKDTALWWIRQIGMVEYDPLSRLSPRLQKAFITATLASPADQQRGMEDWKSGLAFTNNEAMRIATDPELAAVLDDPTNIIWKTVLGEGGGEGRSRRGGSRQDGGGGGPTNAPRDEDELFIRIEDGLCACLTRAAAADTKLRQMLINNTVNSGGAAHAQAQLVADLLVNECTSSIANSADWFRIGMSAMEHGCEAALSPDHT